MGRIGQECQRRERAHGEKIISFVTVETPDRSSAVAVAHPGCRI
jgi:hypothetical protein